MTYEIIHTEERDGFTIELAVAPEDFSPRGQFQNEDGSDDEDTIQKIADGTYDWFQARVTASKAGIVLGTDYLGGCCYESARDFVTIEEGGYYTDMVRSAITEAKASLARLTA